MYTYIRYNIYIYILYIIYIYIYIYIYVYVYIITITTGYFINSYGINLYINIIHSVIKLIYKYYLI